MKRTFLILLLLITVSVAQTTNETNLHMKDTIVTKTVNDGLLSIQLLQNIISVIIGGVLTWIGVYFANKHQKKMFDEQLKHQLKISQRQINVETERKHIDEIKECQRKIKKCIYALDHLAIQYNCNIDELPPPHSLDNVQFNKLMDEILSKNEMIRVNYSDIKNDIEYCAGMVLLLPDINSFIEQKITNWRTTCYEYGKYIITKYIDPAYKRSLLNHRTKVGLSESFNDTDLFSDYIKIEYENNLIGSLNTMIKQKKEEIAAMIYNEKENL